MKKAMLVIYALMATVISVGFAGTYVRAEEAGPWDSGEIQSGKGHPFVCTDYSAGKVFIVNAEGTVEWEYKTGLCNDLWVLPNGNLLFNTGKGVQEVTRDKEVVFNYQSESEIYACQRLANGNTFIAESTSGRLLEVAPTGKIVQDIRLLPEGKDAGGGYVRNARKLDNGHYLVAHFADQVVIEYDGQGETVRTIPAPGGAHSVCRLPNGNTIISCGDKNKEPMVIEVDKDGEIVWKVGHLDLKGMRLQFMTGFQRLPNGNTVMTNWLGHDQFGSAPHIIEVTPEKEVIWTFQDHDTMRTVSSIQLLDVPGDALIN